MVARSGGGEERGARRDARSGIREARSEKREERKEKRERYQKSIGGEEAGEADIK